MTIFDLGTFLVYQSQLCVQHISIVVMRHTSSCFCECSVSKISNIETYFSFLSTGYIHFFGNSSKLDREVYGNEPIVLTVVATDHGFNPHRAEALVEIYLEDVNDNEPLVLSPNGRKDIGFVQIISKGDKAKNVFPPSSLKSRRNGEWASVVAVKEQSNSTGIGSVSLSQIQATDKDLGLNSILSFAIVDGNTDGHFDVDAKTGNVTFMDNVDIDSLKLGCHVLKVEVSDFGTPKLHSYAYVSTLLWSA